ncbi:Phage transcriptional regulator [Streptococcus dysgalactiae subsp. equisimilis]|uniref:Phage transcriptional regulator n=1 Tax=Streptococcus dysgalactiae subsp. equisimilis TaxID=119602 RepID=A0A9X8T3P0_STREQ|nr:helix-turn-helix transcriptional regulator [Streptococcus dysgalactiae]SUN64082.1 Phage transcriptional regulator [Streptococcus dysgalactiae subsp. equisimilis]
MNRLKELRKEKKLTQRELATNTGIPYRTIQRWENGETDIKSDAAQELADYFGVHIPFLLGYSPIRAAEEEISMMIDDFNNDFIEFLKHHDLYLSDNQIPLIINTMYSMSNINDRYLMTYMKNRDFEGLEIAKNMEFNKLFEYSSFWDMQYNGLKAANKFPESSNKVYDVSELQDLLKNLNSED